MLFIYSASVCRAVTFRDPHTQTMSVAFQVTGEINGQIRDRSGRPLAAVSIEIRTAPAGRVSASPSEPFVRRTTTDHEGRFQLTGIPWGFYRLTATHLGYEPLTRDFELIAKDSAIQLALHMTQAWASLTDVEVYAQTAKQRAAEQPIRAIVVDTEAAAEQPVSLAELMNRSPGIRIRQSGGLGHAVDVSINGFQGNSVQYFRDGIPLDYLGGGYGLNNIPINLLDRVEVYKGVVPVSLGADALGGAVNLVTKHTDRPSLHASYEIASFQTHIAQLQAYQPLGNHFFLNLDAFYNYSANNYKADVQVVDANANPVPVTVPLFHNGYRHYFAEFAAGIKNTDWTDELRLSLAHYGIDRESQHPALMTNPYGALTTRNVGLVPSLRYQKTWLNRALALDQFVSYSNIDRARTDTVKGTYDWYGTFRPGTTMGESPRRSLARIDFDQWISRTQLSYRLHPNHKLETNLVLNHNSRIGSDPYGLRFSGTDIDVLSRRATYYKSIAGLTWESDWIDHTLTNQLSVKHFYFKAKGINGFMANATDLDQFTESHRHHFGIANALKYTLGRRSFLRASAELTNRLPREAELFGDNDTRAPNFQLEPERSLNVNVGYTYAADRLHMEVGAFYRKTKGMILLVPVQPPFAQYQNLDSVRGYGFDLDLRYRFNQHWTAQGNVTWQDNRMVDIGNGLHQWIEGTRLRNTPYFFANAGVSAEFADLLHRRDGFKAYAHWNFIREFYLNHIPRDKEPQGFLGLFGKSGVPVTNLVPDQHLLSAGFTYSFANQPLTLGFEVKNIADSKLYDYYKIQRPGRSIHLKLSYALFQKNRPILSI